MLFLGLLAILMVDEEAQKGTNFSIVIKFVAELKLGVQCVSSDAASQTQ